MQDRAERLMEGLAEEVKCARTGHAELHDKAQQLSAQLEASKALAASAEEACRKEQAARQAALQEAEASYEARARELCEKVKWLEAEHAGKEVVLTNKVLQLEMKVENALRERDIVKASSLALLFLSSCMPVGFK
jgi:vacuolar-type H+-ATPase subunit D/Vma8